MITILYYDYGTAHNRIFFILYIQNTIIKSIGYNDQILKFKYLNQAFLS